MAANGKNGNGKKSGRAATIAAIGGLIVALGTAGSQLYKTVYSDEEDKVGANIKLHDAYLRLREANVRTHERINELAKALNQVQGQVQILTAFSVRPPPVAARHSPVHHDDPIHFEIIEQAVLDEVDVLEDLPDEIPDPADVDIEAFIEANGD